MTFTLYKAGTKVNGTHFQATLKCTGCSSWVNTSRKYLGFPRPRVAMAHSPTRPSNANSNTSAIAVHDVHAYIDFDFSQTVNTNFYQIAQTLQ
jgi:hypothetical protein